MIRAAICAALASLLLAGAAEPLPLDDASLLRQMPGTGIDYKLPGRVFSPDLTAKLRAGGVYGKLLYPSHPEQAGLWTAIPLDRWAELIADYAPVSISGNTGNPRTIGLSPFTGKPFAGAEMSDDDFLAHPFRAREKGTDYVIYGREEEMPAGYAARPNRTVMIPHLDGTTHPYRFYVPEPYKDAGEEMGSDRKHWFCSAGEVYRCRLSIIMGKVIPDLVADLVLNDNDKAAQTLTAILDRLADVYPGQPLYTGVKGHGFARGPDHRHYLTADEYRSIAPLLPYINARDRADYPFWYVDIYDFSYLKLHWGFSAWTDGAMDQLGWVAAAFDLVRDREDTRAFSQAKYGDPGAWEARFRERCLKELEFLGLATPPTTGNTSYAYITGSAKLGIACRNQALFRKGLEIIEMYMYNNWQPDGMAGDGSFAYAGMTQSGILGLGWMAKEFGGVDLADRYPLMRTIDELGWAPVKTLYTIDSKHSDIHCRIFRTGSDKYGPAPDPADLPYDTHQASFSLPDYGLTTLRAGAPGNRVELILDHLNSYQHSHFSRLNYQLYSEGVECLPDFGYCVGYVDTDRKPWSEVTTGYKVLGRPELTQDRWGPWKFTYADKPEAHNTVMIDYWQHHMSPCQLYGFAGGQTVSPGLIPFAEADAAPIFTGRPNPVSLFRRQVALVTLPNGMPIVIDIFRVAGGKRHDYFWHVPADTPAFPDAGAPIDAPDLTAYFGIRPPYDKLTGKAIHSYGYAGRYLTQLVRHAVPGGTWASEWLIQPARTFPQPESLRQSYGAWPQLLHDVALRSWLNVSGSDARSEVVSARGPWPGGLTITDPDTGTDTTKTVGLDNALDYRVITRESDEAGLESTYAQVLEPGAPGKTGLATVDIQPVSPIGRGGGVVCRMKTAAGEPVLVASTLGDGTIDTPDVALTGRFAAAVTGPATTLTLYDATRFRAAGWQVDLAPSWEMTLASLDGDLTGHPDRSSLIVRSPAPLPTDDTLKGQLVYVWHQVNSALQTVYTIARVTPAGDGLWRIDLDGRPPFILQRASVMKIDDQDPRQMEQTFQFHLITGDVLPAGRRIRFPRTGFETAMVSCGRSDFTVADTPPAGAIAKGDPFVVYTIQAGDRVTIPNFFRATAGDDGKLTIETSGPVTVTPPGGQPRAIPAEALVNGRGAVNLMGK